MEHYREKSILKDTQEHRILSLFTLCVLVNMEKQIFIRTSYLNCQVEPPVSL